MHLKRLHEKSREEKGKESEGWRRYRRNKRVERRREDYIHAEKGRRGKKEQEVSESIRTELTQDLIPSQEILYQLKEQEVSEPI